MRTEITARQTSDYLGFDPVMAENLPTPIGLLADRGYDADSIRRSMDKRDFLPVIPMRKSRKKRVGIDRALYRLLNLVERCFKTLKNASVSPPATTRPPRASWAPSTSRRSVSGCVICEHDLGLHMFCLTLPNPWQMPEAAHRLLPPVLEPSCRKVWRYRSVPQRRPRFPAAFRVPLDLHRSCRQSAAQAIQPAALAR